MHELLPNDVGCSFITWQVHLWDCMFLNIFHRHITKYRKSQFWSPVQRGRGRVRLATSCWEADAG